MGLGSEMKNLSEEILASFKQRIRDHEELVNDVQKTLDGFRKDHMEMAAMLNANANALRKGLADGEKERLRNFNELLSGIHNTISSIQKEVVAIQTSTFNMISEFASDREEMAEELNKFFTQGREDRQQNEKQRMEDFDALMNEIHADIKSINHEVLSIFKNTNDMLDRFEKEHLEMSAELRTELGKNLADRVNYTRTLLNGFQKRLAEISRENQKMAQKLRKELASGEVSRMREYHGIMKGIHDDIKGIMNDVKKIQHETTEMIGDYSQNRVQAQAEWGKMQDAIATIRKKGIKAAPEPARKVEKKEVVREKPIVEEKKAAIPVPEVIMTLEEKVLDYINKHPKGVKIAEMEEPLKETRMKLGFTAKNLLDNGKVLKVENVYYPKPKL